MWYIKWKTKMKIEDLQKQIDKMMQEQNNRAIPDFEGYSPAEMQSILYDTFGDRNPIQLTILSDSEYKTIPILNQIKFLADLIIDSKDLKLTNKGFLPTKIVSKLYEQRFLTDELIDSGISKLYKEADSITIRLTRILLELGGIIKKRNNKLSITKAGEKILADNSKLLRQIFSVFGSKFNWAYFDGYGENNIGQMGFGFSMILLSKYGNKKQLDKFYADKYFNAFPQLINDSLTPNFGTVESYASNCYSLRTFDRFLDYFGLINIEQDKQWDADKFISKTELYDKLIKCSPHIWLS